MRQTSLRRIALKSITISEKRDRSSFTMSFDKETGQYTLEVLVAHISANIVVGQVKLPPKSQGWDTLFETSGSNPESLIDYWSHEMFGYDNPAIHEHMVALGKQIERLAKTWKFD